MSLDIFLIKENPEYKKWEDRRATSITEAGTMVGLIPIIEEYYEKYKPSDVVILFESNITHNLGKMAGEAGIYAILWHPEDFKIKEAKELVEPLMKGLKRLKKDEMHFRQFDAPNGWGKYEHLIQFVEEVIQGCSQFPDAAINVSR